jgi:hypothetical protein
VKNLYLIGAMIVSSLVGVVGTVPSAHACGAAGSLMFSYVGGGAGALCDGGRVSQSEGRWRSDSSDHSKPGEIEPGHLLQQEVALCI